MLKNIAARAAVWQINYNTILTQCCDAHSQFAKLNNTYATCYSLKKNKRTKEITILQTSTTKLDVKF